MEWWQIVLILLASVVVGILVGVPTSYLIGRITKKPATTPVVEDLFGKVRKRFIKEREALPREAIAHEATPREATPIVEQQVKFTAAGDLLAEIKNNCKIATEPATDKLIPLQTQVWDVRQYDVDKLPANLREELSQVYVDIRLANSIVWLSTEFNRRSPNLDQNYMNLCTSIAERLDRIKPLLNQSGKS